MVIEVGRNVRVVEGGEEMHYRLVDPAESDPLLGRISTTCPLGLALLGHSPGETVFYRAPGGPRSVTVVAVI